MFSNLLDDAAPPQKIWTLFKVSSKERLEQMRKGLIYMNSLDYFASLKDESSGMDTRADPHENVHGVARVTKKNKLILEIDGKQFDLGKKAVASIKYDNTKNIFIFSMGCVADNENGKVTGETDEGIVFDDRFKEFGDHILIISNPVEFVKRYVKALRSRKGIFKPEFLHKGLGRVTYKPLYGYSGPLGVYSKDHRFDWQTEYRLAIGAEDKALNKRGALELHVGDLSDITQISTLQSVLDAPVKIKRTKAHIIGDRAFALKS
ncbi:hypothetical protein [Vibrio vulnificus]|uniref:hypothetical protein n=2 Tax=Vibrio vulnificus TaxID=672 RepID=UPI00405A2939